MTKNVREAAVEILESVENKEAYSNLLLNRTIEKYQLKNADARLLTELCYGTIQRKMTLDYFLEPFIKKQKKIGSWVRQLLRLSVYQFVYLDRIPDHAIINEAVKIAKKHGNKKIGGFINGVLRSFQRKGAPGVDVIKDPVKRLAVETSHPEWLVQRWVKQFGFEQTQKMCFENLQSPLQTARVNEWKTNADEVISNLKEENMSAQKSDVIPAAIKVKNGNLAKSAAFQNGDLTIQDESSMIVAYVLNPQEGERILDACAAPGGKTTHIAEKMKNTGEVIALDLHDHKIKLIEENAGRLQLTNIFAKQMDSREMAGNFPKEYFDRILIDAPCSGFGVLKRKPDIKYRKNETDIKQLSKIQSELLDQAAELLKPGGVLVYSTCTVEKEENQVVSRSFLNRHKDFSGDESVALRLPEPVRPYVNGFEIQIFPHDLKSDGFYIACFRKKV